MDLWQGVARQIATQVTLGDTNGPDRPGGETLGFGFGRSGLCPVQGVEPVFYPRERLTLRWLCWLGVAYLAWSHWVQPPGWGSAVRSIRIDVNHAPLAELRALPGVGAVTAAELVRGRPFRNAGELEALLGSKRWQLARPYVEVR